MSELDDEHAVRTTDADGREVVLDASTRLHLIEGGRGCCSTTLS